MTRKQYKRKLLLTNCLRSAYWGNYARNLIKDLLDYTSRCKPIKYEKTK